LRRAQPALPDAPVMMITAYGDEAINEVSG
jgi:hypothetical protein